MLGAQNSTSPVLAASRRVFHRGTRPSQLATIQSLVLSAVISIDAGVRSRARQAIVPGVKMIDGWSPGGSR